MMSFAQELGQRSLAACVDSRNSWVEETLRKLMTECEAKAAQGHCVACVIQPRPSLFPEDAMALLDQRLADLGFTSKAVVLNWHNNVYAHVTWNMAQMPDETNSTPQGIKGTCPICHENWHLVALTPCGHTVCQQCQKSSGLRQCPMCRENLTGATRALFME